MKFRCNLEFEDNYLKKRASILLITNSFMDRPNKGQN